MQRMLPDVPRRVLQNLLKSLKAEHKAEENDRIKNNRVHIKVLAQGAILAQDSTHVGNAKGRKAFAEVTKDAATLEAWASGDGKPITGKAMLKHLEGLKKSAQLPLVLATDNGSAYKEKEVRAWLEAHEVIQLFSRPHTPTDNARAERGIGEGKALAGLGSGVMLQSGLQGVQALQQAMQALNKHLPRTSKGGLTAAQLKQQLPHWQASVQRHKFYQAACNAIQAVQGESKRAVRRETREAIFRTLELFGLILRTRGEQKVCYIKPDNIS